MKMKNKKITCLICFYINDDVKLFHKAFESILNQTLVPDEIIICVDGEVYENQRIEILRYKKVAKIIWLPKNLGHGEARKTALKDVNNEFIAIFDSDDCSYPNRLSDLFNSIINDPKVGVVSGIIKENWSDGSVTFRNPKNLNFRLASPVNQNCCLIRNSAYKDSGGYVHWYHNEDTYLWVRMLKSKWKIKAVEKVLADVNLDVSSIRRRQGFRYFYSEVKLRNLMYRESLISLRDLLINILIRILIQLILPSLLYKKLYQWRRREL